VAATLREGVVNQECHEKEAAAPRASEQLQANLIEHKYKHQNHSDAEGTETNVGAPH
jgi:hypothetical protein